MKPPRRIAITVGLTVSALAAFMICGWQQGSIRALRAEVSARARGGARPVPPPEMPTEAGPRPRAASVVASQEDAPLTPQERIERLRLRSQVTDLKEKQRTLPEIRRLQENLRTRLASASNQARGLLPEGYLRRTEARNRGNATPEAALETFLWALEHRDLAVLRTVMPGREWARLQEQLTKTSAVEFFNEARAAFPGFAVRSREDHGAEQVTLRMEMGAGKTWGVKLSLEDGTWRIDL